MKRIFWIVPAILLLSISARAQESVTPAWELSGGYSYLKANLGSSSFHLNGGEASATQNLNHWLGGIFEVSAFHGTEAGQTVSAQTFSYGPVFSYRRIRTVTPFAKVQLGAVHASAGYLGISANAIKFAMIGGGGVDVRVNKIASVRLQGDYLMTRFLGLNQNNIQGTVALVFRFGKKFM